MYMTKEQLDEIMNQEGIKREIEEDKLKSLLDSITVSDLASLTSLQAENPDASFN